MFFCGAGSHSRKDQWKTLNGTIGKKSAWNTLLDESDDLIIGLLMLLPIELLLLSPCCYGCLLAQRAHHAASPRCLREICRCWHGAEKIR